MTNASDMEFIIRRARKGRSDAWEEIVKRYEGKVFSIALKMTGNPADASDITQEVFLKVFRSLSTFELGRDFGVWIAKIAVNATYDWTSGGREVSLDEIFENNPSMFKDEAQEGMEERMDKIRLMTLIVKALKDFPPKQRSAFVLKDLENYPTNEVALILDCDETTVRRHLSEARRKIKTMLEREFFK